MRSWRLEAALFGLAALLEFVPLLFVVSPLLVFGGAIAAIAFLFVAIRFPECFLVGVLFIPQLKAYWPLQSIDRSVDLTGVMLAGLAIGLCWRLLRHAAGFEVWDLKRFFYGPKSPVLFFFLFAAVVAVSYLHTTAPSYGETKLLRFLFIGGLLFLSPFFLFREERDLRRFVLLFIGCGLILTFQMVLHLKDRPTVATEDITRIGAGWLMGMCTLLVFCYRIFQRETQHTAAFLVLLPVFAAGLVISTARGPVIALMLVLFLNFILWPRRFLGGKTVLLLTLACVTCYGGYVLISSADPGKSQAKIDELIRLAEGESATGSAEKRFPFYRQTLAAIPNHLLFGEGVGSWSEFYYGSDQRNYPHDLFLEITFEEGLAGLAALCLFLGAVGIECARLLRSTHARYAAFPSLVLFCLTVSMFSGDLDDNRILWFWAGVALSVCRMVALHMQERTMVRRSVYGHDFARATSPLAPVKLRGQSPAR